ncbi:MAG: type II secretion system protein GspK, partial [Pseudomonadota bacterium]
QGVIEIEGAALTATLYDLQGRLNLNRIVSRPEPPEDGKPPPTGAPSTALAEPYYDVLAELISDAEGPARLAPRLAEWIAEGVAGLPGPAGDRPYLGQEAPFLRPTEALLTPQDIRLVDGMEAGVFDALGDSLAALPGLTTININTAPRPVLAALMPGLGPSQLDRFISYRAANPFASRGAFTEYISRILAPAGVAALGQVDLDVKTNWFLLEIAVEHGPSRARLFSVLERPDDGGRAEVVLRSGARL